jgi:hypothetical protein
MNAVKTYKKPWLQRRNDRIAKLYLNGIRQEEIAQKFDISLSNVSQIVHRMGGKKTIRERFGSALTSTPPPDAPLTLDAAYNRLARIYIKMALELHEDLMTQATAGEKMRYLKLIAPVVKGQVRQIKPKPIHFHFDGATAEDLERQLLDYALDGEKSSQH